MSSAFSVSAVSTRSAATSFSVLAASYSPNSFSDVPQAVRSSPGISRINHRIAASSQKGERQPRMNSSNSHRTSPNQVRPVIFTGILYSSALTQMYTWPC